MCVAEAQACFGGGEPWFHYHCSLLAFQWLNYRQVPALGNFVCSVLKENDEAQQERLVLVLELHVNGSQFSFRPIMLIECSLRSSGPKSQSCKQLNPKRI